jgi:ketosteroid isomerase-like protein
MAFDSIAAAIDWLDAYRGKSLNVSDMYADDAALECACSGETLLGNPAIEKYWRERFRRRPALALVNLQPRDGNAVAIAYMTSSGPVRAVLGFDEESGKIVWQRCGPHRS